MSIKDLSFCHVITIGPCPVAMHLKVVFDSSVTVLV
ncbi:hypothetical protein X975_22058, partial [Stegodyphus mimosarum]